MTMFILGSVTTSQVNAVIPDSNNTIHACYTTGLLAAVKIVDATTCGIGETHLTWQQGGSAAGVLRSDIAGKDLSGSQMVYWDLRNMNLAGTILTAANLTGVDLRGATLTNGIFNSTDFSRADMTNTNWSGTSMVGSQFNNTDLTGVTFSNADLASTNFFNQNLSGRNLSSVLRFEGFSMSLGNFSGVTLPSSPNFKNANMNGVNMNNNNFTGADFTGANLVGSTFTDSTMTDVTWVTGEYSAVCPDTTVASSNGDTCAGHLTP